ncbi:MAG: type II toxin-antitoxin system RelE/ParE family toxin [Gemmatimonadaceae bacterium]|nr:type II toxin-antitoxin system RelE/ParE family toxin [Gemmatimonadaceae bacterium]
MIQSFRHKALERLYETGSPRGIRTDLIAKIARILSMLDVASDPQALNLPGYALHPLKGELKGFWAVTVKANWRIVFRFLDGDAYDVELLDYH